jgi:hypothetical protein
MNKVLGKKVLDCNDEPVMQTDFFGLSDFLDGREYTLTIENITRRNPYGVGDQKEELDLSDRNGDLCLLFKQDGRLLRMGKGRMQQMTSIAGSSNVFDWVSHDVTLFVDDRDKKKGIQIRRARRPAKQEMMSEDRDDLDDEDVVEERNDETEPDTEDLEPVEEVDEKPEEKPAVRKPPLRRSPPLGQGNRPIDQRRREAIQRQRRG